MSKDIDQVAASVAEASAVAGLRFYTGVPTGVTNVSTDGWITLGTLAAYNPGFTVNTLANATSLYTVTDSDIGNGIDTQGTTACIISIPNNLTKVGPITVRKGGTGNVTIQGTGGVTLDKPFNRATLITTYQTMSAIPWGSLTHFTLAGAEQ
jgi:hypothetical protein